MQGRFDSYAAPFPAGAALRAVRRTHSLVAEMLILAAVVLVWQLARVPFESSVAEAIANARDWLDAERRTGSTPTWTRRSRSARSRRCG